MSQCTLICLTLSPSPVTNLWLKMQYLQNLSILYLNGMFAFLLFFYNQHIPVSSSGGEVENQNCEKVLCFSAVYILLCSFHSTLKISSQKNESES